MTTARDEVPSSRRSLRVWPGVVIVTLQWLTRFGLPLVMPDAVPIAVIGGIVGGLGVVVWWVFFSRAPWSERLGAVGLMIAAMFATQPITHESIAKGAMGMLFAVLAIPASESRFCRVGGSKPASLGWTSARGDGRHDFCGLRSMDARTYGRDYRQLR